MVSVNTMNSKYAILLFTIAPNETVLMKLWGLETTPLSTAEMRVERNTETTTIPPTVL